MENVNLKASPVTRAQILSLIALEKLANDKDYTIKSYLEHLVGMVAHGNIDQAGINIEVKYEPVELRADGPQLRSIMSVDSYRLSSHQATEGAVQLRVVTTDEDARLFGRGVKKDKESKMDLSKLTLEFSLAQHFDSMLDGAIEGIREGLATCFTEKEYDTILGKRTARFSCSREYGRPGDINNVLAFESRFCHDQAAAIDWLAVFTALASMFDVSGDLDVTAADFTDKLCHASPEQKVACYLKVLPKTTPAAE